MVTISVVYEGELRCRATHDPSGEELRTDAPVDNHGRGESFSPTDLVGVAMGTCMVTIMGIAADKRGLDLTGTTVRVEKRMVADPKRRIGALEIVIAADPKNSSAPAGDRSGIVTRIRNSSVSVSEVLRTMKLALRTAAGS